jgi:hypothetical protein
VADVATALPSSTRTATRDHGDRVSR